MYYLSHQAMRKTLNHLMADTNKLDIQKLSASAAQVSGNIQAKVNDNEVSFYVKPARSPKAITLTIRKSRWDGELRLRLLDKMTIIVSLPKTTIGKSGCLPLTLSYTHTAY